MKTIEPYAIVINFSRTTIWGKVGPFENFEKVYDWCSRFRKTCREKQLDMTAFSSESFIELTNNIDTRTFLPSINIETIIQNAAATSVFPFLVK